MASKQESKDPDTEMDEKKRKRKQSNRESARRSRMRKQQRLDELNGEESEIHKENQKLRRMIDDASQLYTKMAAGNNVLRAQVVELTDRLQSLNSVLEIAAEVSGLAVDIPAIPDTLLEPWQLTCPVQPVTMPAQMFKC